MTVQVRVERRDLELVDPLHTAAGDIQHRPVWLVFVEDEQGDVGVGEAAPLEQAGTESVEVCAEGLASLTSDGLDVAHPASPSVPWPDPAPWEDQLADLLPDAPAARAGVDLALWDLAARRSGRRVADLLTDGHAVQSVPVNALVSTPQEAFAAMEAGFEVIKTKVSGDDADRLASIREAAPGARLRIDANGCWSDLAEALKGLHALRGLDFELVEQPVPADDLFGLVQLRLGSWRVAADEAVRDEARGMFIIDAGSADVVVLKPARLGGLGPCVRLARGAQAAGLGVVVTTMLDGAVGRAGALHLAAAVHTPGGFAHGLATGRLLAEDLAEGPTPIGGRLELPAGPGLGVWP